MWSLPQQPLTIKQVITESYKLFKASFCNLYLMLALFFVLMALPYILMGILYTDWQGILCTYGKIKTSIGLIIYLIAAFWIYGAYYYQLNALIRDQPVSTGHSLLVILKKLPILIAAFIVACITNFVGLMLLVIPCIYLIAVFTLYYPLIIIDDLGPVKGLKRTMQLIWGNWWRSAVVLVLPVIISFLIMLPVGVVILFIGIIFHPSAMAMEVISIYVQVFMGCLFLPISAAINSVQIYNLKLRQSAVSSEAG